MVMWLSYLQLETVRATTSGYVTMDNAYLTFLYVIITMTALMKVMKITTCAKTMVSAEKTSNTHLVIVRKLRLLVCSFVLLETTM